MSLLFNNLGDFCLVAWDVSDAAELWMGAPTPALPLKGEGRVLRFKTFVIFLSNKFHFLPAFQSMHSPSPRGGRVGLGASL